MARRTPASTPAPDLDRWRTATPPSVTSAAQGLLEARHALADADLLAVPVAPAAPGETGVQPREGAADAAAVLGAALGGASLADVADRLGAKGRAGDVTTVPLLAPAADGPALPERVVLLGTGAGTATDLRRAGAALGRAARGRRRLVVPVPGTAGQDGVRAFVEGLLLGGARPAREGVGDAPEPAVGAVHLLTAGADGDPAASVDRAVRAAATAAAATLLTRELAGTPSSTKDPAWVAARAREAAERSGLDVDVWDEQRLAAEGFGGILAVGAGSASPPRLVQLSYAPPRSTGRVRHVVLVGKGITYDTGGLSIKPREAMVPMKTDMAGAAVVLAVLAACRDAGVAVRVTGLLPLAENAFGGASYRPGDVVRHRGGRTTEVLNTDAEGRLVLADALAHADAVLDPDVLVDVATLTGAATVGLGRTHAALYGTDDALVAQLEAAGEATGERVWRMPLVEDYRPSVSSEVADLRNTHEGGAAHGAGSVTAALFLQEFTGGRPWAHLDVAGTARSDKDAHEVPKGATGYGARLLLRWLEGLA